MVDDRPEDTGSLPDSGRPKREPPTIDLEATEVSSETPKAAARRSVSPSRLRANARGSGRAGRGGRSPAPSASRPDLALDRRAGLRRGRRRAGDRRRLDAGLARDSAGGRAACSTPCRDRRSHRACRRTRIKGRQAAAHRSRGCRAHRGAGKIRRARCAANSRRRVRKARSSPPPSTRRNQRRATTAPAPDLSGIDERIAKIESADADAERRDRAARQQARRRQTADAKPADDMPLRRLVAAALLDVLVRIGDPYPAALAAAKPLAPNPDALKPLDQFADKGVPNAAG